MNNKEKKFNKNKHLFICFYLENFKFILHICFSCVKICSFQYNAILIILLY